MSATEIPDSGIFHQTQNLAGRKNLSIVPLGFSEKFSLFPVSACERIPISPERYFKSKLFFKEEEKRTSSTLSRLRKISSLNPPTVYKIFQMQSSLPPCGSVISKLPSRLREGIKGRVIKALTRFSLSDQSFCPLLNPPPQSGGGV